MATIIKLNCYNCETIIERNTSEVFVFINKSEEKIWINYRCQELGKVCIKDTLTDKGLDMILATGVSTFDVEAHFADINTAVSK